VDRDRAIDRVERVLDRVAGERTPVPVREVWVYGDLALGLDPVDRLDVYLTKDVRLDSDGDEVERRVAEEYGVRGVGKAVSAEWAEANPELVRAGDGGHVAPERCLAAQLLPADEPAHLEVCNASFEDNVTRRLRGALAREAYDQILDPRGVCLYLEGERDDDALDRLRAGEFAFPTLSGALEMLGLDEAEAERAAAAVERRRAEREGRSVRGDVL